MCICDAFVCGDSVRTDHLGVRGSPKLADAGEGAGGAVVECAMYRRIMGKENDHRADKG